MVRIDADVIEKPNPMNTANPASPKPASKWLKSTEWLAGQAGKPNVVVVAVPYLVGHEYEHEERGPRWTAESSVITGEVPAAKKTN